MELVLMAETNRLHAQALDRRCAPSVFLRHRRAWMVGRAVYRVASHDGRRLYVVRIRDAGEVTCSCAAGSAGRACVHACAVLRRLLREAKRTP